MFTRRLTRTHGNLVVLVLALVFALLVAAVADARVMPEVRAGYYFDAESVFLGGGLLIPLGSGSRWMGNPNLEWIFIDNFTYLTLNGDVHYDLNAGPDGPAYWVGGGLAVIVVDPHDDFPGNGGSETDVGLNLLGGVGAKHGSVRPFGQFKAILSDDAEVSLAGGLRF